MIVWLAGCRAANPAYTPFQIAADASDLSRADGVVEPTSDGNDFSRVPAITCPADNNLILCCRFEGSLKDESPSKLNVQSGTVRFAPGKDGQAVRIAADSMVHTPMGVVPASAHATLEAWISPSTLPEGSQRAGVLDHNSGYSIFVYPSGVIRCGGVGAMELLYSPPGLIRAGVWSSVACVVDDNTMTLWVDGVLKASQAKQPTTTMMGTEVVIGANNVDSANPDLDPFDGMVDNVRIWHSIRTPAQICAASLNCQP